MKHLKEYFLESKEIQEIQDLKNRIKNEIDKTDETYLTLLQKINKLLSSKGLDNKLFTDRLEFVGLGYAQKTILQKINAYDNLPEFINMYANNDKLPSSIDLIKGNNIYDLIFKDNESDREITKDINKELIEDLADLTLSKNSITKGNYEILTQLFLKDINKDNKNYEGKHGDINAEGNGKGIAIEYKVSGARMLGQGTLNSPEVIYKKMEELIKNIYNNSDITSKSQEKQSSLIRLWQDNELEKALDEIEINSQTYEKICKNIDKCFQSNKADKNHPVKNFDTLFQLLIDANFSPELINSIITNSLLEQIPSSKRDKNDNENEEFLKFVRNYSPVQNDAPNYDNMKIIFGVMHMYFYQRIENFDYMVIFKKNTSKGDYIVLTHEDYKNFNTLKDAMDKHNLKVGTMPGYKNGAREYAVTIICK